VQLSGRYDDHLAITEVCTGLAEKYALERLAHPDQPVVNILRGRHAWSVRQAPQHEPSEFDLTSSLLGRPSSEPPYLAFAADQNVQLPFNVD
jgi:hypothetical protein